MMHQIKKDAEQRFITVLTEDPVELDAQNLEFLTDRLRAALAKGALPVMEDPAAGSPIPSAVRQLWTHADSLIEQSRAMAAELQKQPGTALPGLLVVARGTLSNDEIILVAKIEHQTAIRIEPSTNAAGHQVFVLERLRDLVFGDGAKVYKVAVLSKAGSSAGPLVGELVDVQNKRTFAAYFISKFMGLQLREEPAVMTERFLDRMTAVINDSSLLPEEKLDVQSALISHIGSNASQIDPQAFIREFVPSSHQSLIATAAANQAVPMVIFPKDNSRVASRIRHLRVQYSDGILVIAPPDEVGPGKKVQVSPSNDGNGDTITISGGRVGDVRSDGR